MTVRRDLFVRMSDGVQLAVRLHLPADTGQFPALFGVSPYRFDNDDLPDTKRFLWRETGPIHWYLEQGYAYVRLDVRGTGRSGGDYGFFDSRERRDLYEVIEWIAAQPWGTGKVGGIGESYYGTSQWCMAAERPPHLACIAPYDGHVDLYNGWAYTGGIPSDFMSLWWNSTVRPINRNPANEAPPRELPYDLSYHLGLHPTVDEYWKERQIFEQLADVSIPVFSIGVWAKMDLHLGGNISGWQQVKGPKWLMITGAPNAFEACAEFETHDFHERVLLPFYDRYLKGLSNGFENRSPVEVFMRGVGALRASSTWPPDDVKEKVFYLDGERSGAVQSLNDGSLVERAAASDLASTSYDYPRRDWAIGVATLDEKGPDPLREILTFTSQPLDRALDISGPCELSVYLSSTARDADSGRARPSGRHHCPPQRGSGRARPSGRHHQGVAARLASPHRCGPVIRSFAGSGSHQPAAADAGRDRRMPRAPHARGVSRQAGLAAAAGNRQRRFTRHRSDFLTHVHAGQGRQRHHSSFGRAPGATASLGYRIASLAAEAS